MISKSNDIKKFISFFIERDLDEEFWKDHALIFESAFIHRSCDCPHQNYERLELLGDSVISLVITDNLYKKNCSVKDICNRRKEIVSGISLSWIAKKLEMDKYVSLGKGCYITDSILEDIYESFIGACYVCFGYLEAKKIVEKTLFNSYLGGELILPVDYKTQFQELIQKKFGFNAINYLIEERLKDSFGREIFNVCVMHKGSVLGRGQGLKIKDAEQNAAKNALLKLKVL